MGGIPPSEGGIEPISQEVVDLRESLLTWVICVRTRLRVRVGTSFAYHKYWEEAKGRVVCYDQGGKIIEDMRAEGLQYMGMPPWYLGKWEHLANMTWIFQHQAYPPYLAFQRHQIWDVRRRLRARMLAASMRCPHQDDG